MWKFQRALLFLRSPLLVAAAAAAAACLGRSSGDLRTSDKGDAALRSWSPTALSSQHRGDLKDVSSERRVIVVLGISGAGKSSTCNTLAGRQVKPLRAASGLSSVTAALSFRDYSFANSDWRVIDTPGLEDTHRTEEDVRGELSNLAKFAPHGISAFLLVVPRARFTRDDERVLRFLVDAIGDRALASCTVIAVTSCLDPETRGSQVMPSLLSRDSLMSEVDALPRGHILRDICERVRYRVVPVENLFDPPRQVSRMSLYQRVLEVLDATSSWGEGVGSGDHKEQLQQQQQQQQQPRVRLQPLLDVSEWSESLLRAAKRAQLTPSSFSEKGTLGALLQGIRLADCDVSLQEQRGAEKKTLLTLQCVVSDDGRAARGKEV